MKKIYNFMYCVDNSDYNGNYLVDFEEFMQEESSVMAFLSNLEFSPNPKVVDSILEFAKS